MMERKDIESTMISSIGYDIPSSTLEIEFKRGVVWQYYDFPESTWYEFENTESQGKFFLAQIKGQFREAQVG
jgi:hypothetical protein